MDGLFGALLLLFDKVRSAAERIGATVREIEDIADLTNPLSLDAAIQAAGAGLRAMIPPWSRHRGVLP